MTEFSKGRIVQGNAKRLLAALLDVADGTLLKALMVLRGALLVGYGGYPIKWLFPGFNSA